MQKYEIFCTKEKHPSTYKNAHTYTKVEVNLILLEASCKKNAWYFP